jgi:DNA-directed RNA polymerase specialized sigma24 family protein
MNAEESAFGELAESYQLQLQLHCYRLLGSVEEAEDLVQETVEFGAAHDANPASLEHGRVDVDAAGAAERSQRW